MAGYQYLQTTGSLEKQGTKICQLTYVFVQLVKKVPSTLREVRVIVKVQFQNPASDTFDFSVSLEEASS